MAWNVMNKHRSITSVRVANGVPFVGRPCRAGPLIVSGRATVSRRRTMLFRLVCAVMLRSMPGKWFYRNLILTISLRTGRISTPFFCLALGLAACGPKIDAPPPGSAAQIGGRFALTDTAGRRIDQRILTGKWSLVFFGYTFCPDVCPTTLTALGQAVIRLGTRADRVQVVFVTVDPQRDTPTHLQRYLASPSFPKGVIGLTGSPADIAAVARAYHVYYKTVPDGATYSMDHTAVVYLMDPQGRFVGPIDPSTTPAAVAAQIEKAMAAG